MVSGLSIFESNLVAWYRYPRFHANCLNSSIGLPIPSAKPWQNAAKARNRRLSVLRIALLFALFTSSNPDNQKISHTRTCCPHSSCPNSSSRLLLNSHTDAPRATSETLDVGPPSHRNTRMGCVTSGRLAGQALPSGLVARIVIADQANGSGSELSVYTHPFITVRRSLRTGFAIGQRSIFASFVIRHCSSPPEPTNRWQAAS